MNEERLSYLEGKQARQEIEQQSVYYINPPSPDEGELIVDFELIRSASSTSLVFSTTFNSIYLRTLQSSMILETLYDNTGSKSLVADHWLSSIHYYRECDKLFTIS